MSCIHCNSNDLHGRDCTCPASIEAEDAFYAELEAQYEAHLEKEFEKTHCNPSNSSEFKCDLVNDIHYYDSDIPF